MILLVFEVKYQRVLDKRVALNRQILKNKYWFLPFEDDRGRETFVPSGRGEVTSDACASVHGQNVCKDVEAHKGVVKRDYNGVVTDFTNKIVVRLIHWWCNNASCPKCWLRGWSVRSARRGEKRVDKAVERGFGEPLHVVVSVPLASYGKLEKDLREDAREALRVRGFFGGLLLYHHFRIDRERDVLKVGKHYHALCFNRSYCRGANGVDEAYEKLTREEFKMDGWIVKVEDKRATVFGTLYYELNHASLKLGLKRFKAFTYFGEMGYNNFKGGVLDVKAEVKCPVCAKKMVKCRNDSGLVFAKDIGDVNYKAWFGLDASYADSFIEVVEGRGSFG